MYDVLIIGAGITGLAIARRLSRYNLRICVLEKEPDVAMGATKANSAIVHGGYAEDSHTLKGQLCYKGRVQFARLDSELHFGFRQTGSLVLAAGPEDLPGLQALLENGRRNGLPDLEILSGDQIFAVEPNASPQARYALYCRGAGVCSPYEMAIALAESAVANGVRLFLNEEVTGITRQGDGFWVDTSAGRRRAAVVVNCGGLQSGHLAGMAGDAGFTIHPRSGQYILLAKGTGSLLGTVVFQMPTSMGKGILVTPTYHGNLLIGPDALDQEGADRSTDVRRLEAIYRQGLAAVPRLDITKFIRSFAGVRAVSSTGDFIVGAGAAPGFINVAGIQSPGLTSSPAIADRVAELVAEAGLRLLPNPRYNPCRRPIISPGQPLSVNEAMRLAALPHGDERLVCRCEQVAQGVILDSLRRGIPVTTVDGVKRRTRASMGFCQGNFCRPRIKELLEREYGVPIDDRTDVQRAGVARVGRQEFLDYLKSRQA